MRDLIAQFPDQLLEGVQIGKAAKIHAATEPIFQIFAAGMGGSAIGANFVSEFVRADGKAGFTIGKGYEIPAFIGKDTLCIASSYSGNTEETIASLHQMLATEAKIVVVASGGKLIDIAREKGLDFVQLPGGYSSPRACLGFSIVAQLSILEKLGLISEDKIFQVKKAAALLKREQEDIRHRAERIAFHLQGKLPIIYSTDRMEAAAVRLRQQLNENSKVLCWHHVLPEMNHNELVGWRQKDNRFAAIFLRNADDHPRVQARLEITKDIVGHFTEAVIELYSKGESLVERALYFVHLADWISLFLAELRGIDPVEIRVIDHLKNELSKLEE